MTRTCSVFALVFTVNVCDFAFGFAYFTLVAFLLAPERISTEPIPEFASTALTVIFAPFFFFARTEATLTALAGAVVATAVAALKTGAVVSRMMSSW